MKKSEILQLINLNLKLLELEPKASIAKSNFLPFELSIEKLFPSINDLEESFRILKKEVRDSYYEMEKITKKIAKYNCQHSVRLEYPDIFLSSSKCVFCHKNIMANGVKDGNTIYNNINRNKNCVKFLAKMKTDDELSDIDYINSSSDGYELSEVYQIIINILEDKSLEEEIDLVDEIKKLQLKNCVVDMRKDFIKEYYILIIGGSNKFEINNGHFISNYSSENSLDLANYFLTLPHTNVELFDIDVNINSIKFDKYFKPNNSNFRYKKYNSICDLEQFINMEKDVPFDLIIDTSNVFNYKVKNSQIISKKHDLKLPIIFNNSKIVYMPNIYDYNQEKIISILEEQLSNIDRCYIHVLDYQDYYLENNELERLDFDNTCHKLKKLLYTKK